MSEEEERKPVEEETGPAPKGAPEVSELEPAPNESPVDTIADTPPPEEDPVERLEALLVEEKDRALRALAEAENTRKRAERELADKAKYGASALARDLLGVVDSLERALAEGPGKNEDAATALRKGVEITLHELMSTLRRHGIERLSPAPGDPFDPDRHQAMQQIERDDVPAGSVAEAYSAGYMLQGRLLRPAAVVVAKAPADAGAKEQKAAAASTEASTGIKADKTIQEEERESGTTGEGADE